MKLEVYTRQNKDKQAYTVFYGIKPKHMQGEKVEFIGVITSKGQAEALGYNNGRASITKLKNILKKGLIIWLH